MDQKRRDILATCLTQLFGSVDESFVDGILPLLRWVELGGGETLFREGDPGNGVYFLVSGRLRASVTQGGSPVVVGEIGRGETVGEMAALSGESRSATVTAIRDSVLAHADGDVFQELWARQPELSLSVARLVIDRLRRRGDRGRVHRPSTICLLAVTDGIDVPDFARSLRDGLDRWGVATVESASHVDEQFGDGVAQATPAQPDEYGRLTLWLDDLEFWNEFVLLVGDPGDTEWTRRCLRQADEVLLLARGDAAASLHGVETALCSGDGAVTRARQTLVLVQPAGTRLPSGTPAWLARRDLGSVLHVRRGSARDLARLARIVSGNAVGLVLSGGGARGFAHLGVYRALEEAGIEVDLVAGTSMGAAMGAAIALDLRADELLEIARKTFRRSPMGDYSLPPMVSVFRGRRLRRAIEGYVRDAVGGEADVCDTWRTLRCVATNYTRASEQVLSRGPLAKAILASASIPVALPPVPWEGDLLVDGCIFNNFPTSVMHAMNARRIIGVDLSNRTERAYGHDEVPGPLELLRDSLRGRSRRYRVPSLGTMMMTTSLLYSESRREQARGSVDVYIHPDLAGVAVTDWQDVDRIAELGYESARRALAAMSEQDLAAYRGG